MDLTFAQKLNESGAIASVQLLRTMATQWSNKELLHLLQLAKDLVFRFIRRTVAICDTIDNAEERDSETGSDKWQRRQLVEEFVQLRLQETFRSFSEWLNIHSASSLRTVSSLEHELKVVNCAVAVNVFLRKQLGVYIFVDVEQHSSV